MAHYCGDWGISLSTDDPERLSWAAGGDLFFAMVESFLPPEREAYQISRSELEEYIREERALFPREIDEDDHEWIDLLEFVHSTKQDKIWLYAWW